MSESNREMDRRVFRGAGGTLAVKILNLGLAFAVQVLLARSLGPRGFGAFTHAITWATVLSWGALLGFDKVVVREIARDLGAGLWGRVRGVVAFSTRAVTGLGLLTMIVSGLVVALVTPAEMRNVLLPALTMIPLLGLIRVWSASMRGLGRVGPSEIPELAMHPVLFLVVVGVIFHLDPTSDARTAVIARSATLAAATVAAAFMLRRTLPEEARAHAPVVDRPAWWSAAFAMALIGVMYLLNNHLDILFLGALREPTDVALYAAGDRLARLVLLVLLVVNRAVAPEFSRLWGAGDRAGLQRLATRSARAVLLFSLPVAAVLVLAREPLLAFFGPEFTAAGRVVVVLTVAQLVNAATGSVGLILLMTGEEKTAAKLVGMGALLNGILNAVLIPRWGAVGAAAATGTAIAFVNVAQAVTVYRRLGVLSTAFGRPSKP